jgi:hypothetical protein
LLGRLKVKDLVHDRSSRLGVCTHKAEHILEPIQRIKTSGLWVRTRESILSDRADLNATEIQGLCESSQYKVDIGCFLYGQRQIFWLLRDLWINLPVRGSLWGEATQHIVQNWSISPTFLALQPKQVHKLKIAAF